MTWYDLKIDSYNTFTLQLTYSDQFYPYQSSLITLQVNQTTLTKYLSLW